MEWLWLGAAELRPDRRGETPMIPAGVDDAVDRMVCVYEDRDAMKRPLPSRMSDPLRHGYSGYGMTMLTEGGGVGDAAEVKGRKRLRNQGQMKPLSFACEFTKVTSWILRLLPLHNPSQWA